MGRAGRGLAHGAGNTQHGMVLVRVGGVDSKEQSADERVQRAGTKSGLLTVQGMQQATIHTGMFMQALAAHEAGNERLLNFYVERFPPELRKAYDAWLAEKPFENPNADPHPFVPKLYETPGTREAAEANAKAANSLKEARNAGNVSGQYLANTVLFATVLFFASASGRFEQRRVRVVAFAFAVAVFLFAVVRITMLPL
jgi:hypothetical protein